MVAVEALDAPDCEYDGLPGDPDDARRFVSVKLRERDGALVAGQVDYHPTDKARVEVGLWRYTVPVSDLLVPSVRHFDQGAFASIEGPVPGHDAINTWLRVGVAEGRVQPVSSFIGTGFVIQGPIKQRPDDRLGFALARAALGSGIGSAGVAGNAETTLEASYQVKVSDNIAIQPDVQYILDPSGRHDAPNALALGLRVVLTTGFPAKVKATEATDPTVPPDGPPPPDQPENGPKRS